MDSKRIEEEQGVFRTSIKPALALSVRTFFAASCTKTSIPLVIMATPHLTPVQLAEYNDDRRTELYGSLLTLLVLNNLAVAARLLAHYRKHYRTTGRVYPEDPLILLSGVRARLSAQH